MAVRDLERASVRACAGLWPLPADFAVDLWPFALPFEWPLELALACPLEWPLRAVAEPVHFLAGLPPLAFPAAGRSDEPLEPRPLEAAERLPVRALFTLLDAGLLQREVDAVRPEPADREPADREPEGRALAGREPDGREAAGREAVDREAAGRDPALREPAERELADREPFGREAAEREAERESDP